MTHAWTLREATRDLVYMRLQHRPDKPYDAQTSPRLFNRQLKSYMTGMHAGLVSLVLKGYSKFIQHSDTTRHRWCPSLIALLVLCMTAESLQASMRCKEETEKSQGLPANNNETSVAVERLDKQLAILIKLFITKYHQRKSGKTAFNPVASDIDYQEVSDSDSRDFALLVRRILEKHGE